ncbi:3-ketoacyl-ACP reductase [Bacillus paralicheniformis]|uniref:SDR family NAD(P)-dependent oxidoreductase n=1 Tax=Bacillus TaxID=1386 RepID=UPI00039B5C8E|nr:SDR family NAD(P)-dependent oxidoreductase [Bacillus paralicheniformis]MSO00188.1 SDR family oxidoreductase [Bacillus paralicheniformis]MSO04195.1 SDR family oxidoreductase [Bacillus paralicheniformis]MSO08188.1 SDR family oxidoreductase [Bacillus paralicheniformis]MSO12182.1 SDR family oxidoreductase [Bacillus paralicheniformis]NJE38377.1 SDR family oxidoreductase [Bacillus paralicheniformis]
MEMKNKTALVTGGGTGIGRAVSLALANRGAAVIVNYSRSEAEAEETVGMIENQGGRALAIKADVSKANEVQGMFDRAVREFGTVDMLVNNASITRHIELDDLDGASEEVWDELYAVNVKGMFYCARAAKQNKQGAIVNVGSIAGLTGSGSSLPYAVSKAAVHGLTKSLAHALAPDIRVSCVAPGAVSTRWWEGNEEKMKRLSQKLPLERIAEPEDIALLICALLEQETVTGQILTADCGQTL